LKTGQVSGDPIAVTQVDRPRTPSTLGFIEVGTAAIHGGSKTVSYLSCPLQG
jgi:predicted GNAT superfamily acetyltransferase